jgi:hypothetical protein
VLAPASELGPDYVVFDCPARLDLAGLLMIARGPEPRVKHGAADGFVVALRDALFTAAAHEDPRDGGPCCIGTMGHANVLFARDGRFWLIGLGHNLALADEHGRIGGRSTAFHAPEVAVGGRPTKSSDLSRCCSSRARSCRSWSSSDRSCASSRATARASVPGRGPLRRLVSTLTRARLERPGAGLDIAALFAAGWPGERARRARRGTACTSP